MATPKRPQLNRLAKGKTTMNRTSGVAGRNLGRSEGIATKLKYGAPLTGSASGVKSISLKDVGETLTQGTVSVSRKGLKVDPVGLAMALPLGKVAEAAQALRNAGKMSQGFALEGRLAAKTAGKLRGINIAERSGRTPVEKLSQGMLALGTRARKNSEKIYPRAKFGENPLGNLTREQASGAAKTLGRAASKERGLARSLRGVAGEKNRSMNLFKDSVANERLGKKIGAYKKTAK